MVQLIKRSLFFFAAASLLCPVLAAAQVADPRIVEFQPSADHDRIENGAPLVQRYELQFFVVGSGLVLQRIDLGKPVPGVNGLIRAEFGTRLGSWPASGPTYEALVVAIGPTGWALSAPSNTFTFPSAPPPAPGNPQTNCTYDVWPGAATMSSIATTSTFSVSAGSGCSWAPTSSDAWLTVTDTSTRTGNGSVTFRASQNTTGMTRIATVRVGAASFVVTQQGSCGFTVTPTSQGFNPGGGSGSISVTGSPGCSWTAVRSGSWITITSGASGSSNGTVRYSVSANGGSSSRIGTLTVAGVVVSIIQSSATAPDTPANLRVVVIR